MTKIPILDTLLSSEDTNGSIIELDNFIGELCEYGDDISKLTDYQKSFYLNQNLEREINNGGFNQYFRNSSGDNAHETILSLKAIGADSTADILQKAINQFPNKNVPKDRDERTVIVEQIEETADEVWSDLDQKFHEYEDDLNTLNIEYVKKYKEFF
ncbi:DMP19 family protein [Flavihumibacter petaseus]|uniref:DNA mimic protein DMP19 C-terminal domain-containing protein n=1 Tax=Flavihumibacter petaseus NBRC 106054 TaxID=1220578 RepID=A0A0E9N0M4_9BACT|nr:DMP19 family protein [Flavihumibacter petaseus]GAO43338.1 hypothetical protein FPE01S_02_04430 [Flavihumibacter petaseus NBRC 106054]